MSHISMSHVTHINESCHTYQWVMSHISMSHVTHINESCHTYEWVMNMPLFNLLIPRRVKTHSNHFTLYWYTRVSCMNVHRCVMSESTLGHTYEWVMSMKESSHIWILTHRHDSFTCVRTRSQTWLIHTCVPDLFTDMTHSYVWPLLT